MINLQPMKEGLIGIVCLFGWLRLKNKPCKGKKQLSHTKLCCMIDKSVKTA